MKKTSPIPQDLDFSHLDYLEQVDGKEALDFAHKNNKLSDERLKTDKRYKKTYSDIFKILSAKDKLPSFYQMNGEIYNFWQDNKHKRGLFRKTSIKSFNSGKPRWNIVLDIDKLAQIEQANWVYKGISCLQPNYEFCLVKLSDGGKDAIVTREFNLKNKKFVDGGFYIPESKSSATWIDENTIAIGDATDSSTLTSSGYPSQIKILRRGQKLSAAKVIFSCEKNFVSVGVLSELIHNKRYTYLVKKPSFFESDVYLFNQENMEIIKLPIPTFGSFISIFKDQVLFSIRKEFMNFPAGSLLSFKLSDIKSAKPEIQSIFTPTKTSFFEYATKSKSFLWIGTLSDVKRQLLRLDLISNTWNHDKVHIGDTLGNESVISVDDESEHVYMSYSDFLTPTSIYYSHESLSKKPKIVMKSPTQFNSRKFKIEQFKAKSKDGTLIPYFVVSKKDLKFNGKNATLLYGYGGFEISMTANYLGSTGKVWLEKGGAYVLSNIRGGGEYGPKWHQAALRENRHKAYEDFYAIAEDIITKKITSAKHLGIRGGSNGGLLTSVAFTQRPELFNAVISEVPLANMLEYHRWLAGASWIEEYGNPDDPKMRKYLLSYSPLHNLKKEAKYPEVFYITSTKDDRVHPGHARQMVARMQELGHPVLYNENTDGGHGRASNMKDLAEFLALEFTYLYQKLL